MAGYYFVNVEAREVEVEPGEVAINVAFAPGPQVFVREPVKLEGVRAFREEELRAGLDLELPAVFTPRLPRTLRGKVLAFYRRRGYSFVEVRTERQVDLLAARVSIALTVEEGPLTTINSIEFEGNELTRDGVLERSMKISAGDLYNEDLVGESYRELLRSGLFETVTVEGELVEGTSDRLRLLFRVEERSPWDFQLRAGYGSWEGLRGAVGVQNINVLGSGHRLRAEGLASFRRLRGEVEYTNPFFFSARASHGADFLYERREQRSYTGREIGGETGLGYRLTENLHGRLSYRLRQSDAVEVSSSLPAELRDDVLLSSVNLAAVLDTRDSSMDSAPGFMHQVALEYSGGALSSELDFLRVTASSVWTLPLFSGLRLVSSGQLGAIERLEDTDLIPVQERFFLGGEDTIRSFEEDEAGPATGGKPIGGEAFLQLSLELRIPLPFLPFLENLEGAVFGDLGTVNEHLSDFGGGRYFFAVGAGLRQETPVGPFRFDVAFNPDRQGDEDEFVLHFGVGYP
jgi:outer membrane protein insertion porin family